MKNQLIATTMILAASLAPAASNHQTALETIESALQSKNSDTRKAAVDALGFAGSKYQPRLVSMLQDKDSQVRLTAVAGLADAKDAAALRLALDDNAPEVRFAAAKALYAMNDPAGEQALLRVLNGDTKTSSGFVAGEKREVIHTVETPKSLMIAAVKGSALLSPVPGTSVGVSMAGKAMKNQTASDRAATAVLLGKANHPEVIAALERAVTDPDAKIRAAAIQAIALTNDASLAKHAEALLTDKNRTVRLHAAAAYLRLSSIESSDAAAEE
jgi:HEAT repeat protein